MSDLADKPRTLRTVDDLADAGLAAASPALRRVAARYAVAITPALLELIDAGDPDDPIARQFVPTQAELETTGDERADPIGDAAHSPVPGIVHRHRDRVLLKAVHVCPVYCRFCFRREAVGPDGEGALAPGELDAAIAYIASDPDIWEVILTGGDPFMLSPRRAGDIARRLAAIAHVKVVRWHTRMPVAAPERVTQEMAAAIKVEGAATWVAAHVNHARELTPAAVAALSRLVDAGVPVVSQTVLLQGVNDDAAALEALMRALVAARVKPYYLHHGDLAPGTAHLRTSLAAGRALADELRAAASGLCQPTYVLDIPGGVAKVPAGRPHVRAREDRWEARGPDGVWRRYPEEGVGNRE